MQIEGKRFLVTGAAGLIGSSIVDRLVEGKAAKIIALDNMVRGLSGNLAWAQSHGNVELLQGDIQDQALVKSLLDAVDGVFHMAALRIRHCDEDPELALQVMFVAPYRMFFEASRRRGLRVVAASSSSVYGQADAFPTDEQHHPYNDFTIYGTSKLACEGILRSLHQRTGLPYACLRFFNVYGPRMDIHGVYTEVLVRWMENIEKGLPPLIFGDGSAAFDFTYVDDAARGCVHAMTSDVTSGAFNIGTGVSTSLLKLAETLTRVMGGKVKPELKKDAPVSGGVYRRMASMDRAQRLLGYTAEIDVEEGLGRLVAWWRENRQRLAG